MNKYNEINGFVFNYSQSDHFGCGMWTDVCWILVVGCWRKRMLIYENSQNCQNQHTVILLHQTLTNESREKFHLQSLKQKQRPEENEKKSQHAITKQLN